MSVRQKHACQSAAQANWEILEEVYCHPSKSFLSQKSESRDEQANYIKGEKEMRKLDSYARIQRDDTPFINRNPFSFLYQTYLESQLSLTSLTCSSFQPLPIKTWLLKFPN